MVTAAKAEECRLALVLALDVSGSVNADEFALQVQGLAQALDHPVVRALILDGGDAPISLTVFEWSSQNHQEIILPWVSIGDAEALDSVVTTIAAHTRIRAGLKTAMGDALAVAAAMLEEQAQCWAHVIDVSGDGRNNIGPAPRDVYRLGAFDRVVVNALVVGGSVEAEDDAPGLSTEELRAYYEAEVIHGPGAFTIIANGYQDYARAMQLKLMRELALPILGQLQAAPDLPRP